MEIIGLATMSQKDNVATAVEDIKAGQRVKIDSGQTVLVLDNIPFGHKVALVNIPQNGEIIKYGEPIGIAAKSIKAGQHVHVHNVDGARGRGDLTGGIV